MATVIDSRPGDSFYTRNTKSLIEQLDTKYGISTDSFWFLKLSDDALFDVFTLAFDPRKRFAFESIVWYFNKSFGEYHEKVIDELFNKRSHSVRFLHFREKIPLDLDHLAPIGVSIIDYKIDKFRKTVEKALGKYTKDFNERGPVSLDFGFNKKESNRVRKLIREKFRINPFDEKDVMCIHDMAYSRSIQYYACPPLPDEMMDRRKYNEPMVEILEWTSIVRVDLYTAEETAAKETDDERAAERAEKTLKEKNEETYERCIAILIYLFPHINVYEFNRQTIDTGINRYASQAKFFIEDYFKEQRTDLTKRRDYYKNEKERLEQLLGVERAKLRQRSEGALSERERVKIESEIKKLETRIEDLTIYIGILENIPEKTLPVKGILTLVRKIAASEIEAIYYPLSLFNGKGVFDPRRVGLWTWDQSKVVGDGLAKSLRGGARPGKFDYEKLKIQLEGITPSGFPLVPNGKGSMVVAGERNVKKYFLQDNVIDKYFGKLYNVSIANGEEEKPLFGTSGYIGGRFYGPIAPFRDEDGQEFGNAEVAVKETDIRTQETPIIKLMKSLFTGVRGNYTTSSEVNEDIERFMAINQIDFVGNKKCQGRSDGGGNAKRRRTRLTIDAPIGVEALRKGASLLAQSERVVDAFERVVPVTMEDFRKDMVPGISMVSREYMLDFFGKSRKQVDTETPAFVKILAMLYFCYEM